MAVQLETNIKRFRGLSTDVKPGHHDHERTGDSLQSIPVGSVFTEVDTGKRYVWCGSWPWERQNQTVETLLADLIDVGERILQTLQVTHRGHEEHLWEEDVEPE